ncbi:MAG: hypothetical protein Q8S84_07080 [bacterium]|nr:hypothetical protein [bacterium]MDP3381219.1 hypothetical protein [bacterium]
MEAQKLHDKLLLEANSTQNSEAKHEKLVKNTSKSVAVDSDLSPQKTTYLPTVKFQEVFDSLPEIYKTSKSSDLKMNL